MGSAVNDTTRQVGGALGVAIIGSVYSSVYASQIAGRISGLHLGGGRGCPGDQLHRRRLRHGGGGGRPGRADPGRGGQPGLRGRHAPRRVVGAAVALAGAVVALVYLPARAPESADEGVFEDDQPNVFGLVEGEAGDPAGGRRGRRRRVAYSGPRVGRP